MVFVMGTGIMNGLFLCELIVFFLLDGNLMEGIL